MLELPLGTEVLAGAIFFVVLFYSPSTNLAGNWWVPVHQPANLSPHPSIPLKTHHAQPASPSQQVSQTFYSGASLTSTQHCLRWQLNPSKVVALPVSTW